MRKYIIGLLVICMLLCAFVGCGKNPIEQNTTSASETEVETKGESEMKACPVKAVNYDGSTFSIYSHGISADSYIHYEFNATELNQEPINDSIYNRNEYIAEKYNVEFKFDQCLAYAMSKVTTALQSGSDTYDLVLPGSGEAYKYAMQGYLTEVHNIPHLNLNEEWYADNYLEETSIAHKNYSLIGDININAYDSMGIFYFNKEVMEQYTQLDNPFDLVKNDEWTLEKLASMCKVVTHDNGDSTMDQNDYYGFTCNSYAALLFSYGSNQIFAIKDDDDEPNIEVNQNFLDFFTRVVSFVTDPEKTLFSENYGVENRIKYCQEAFYQNRVLFSGDTLEGCNKLRLNDVEFGVIPMPKADDEQKGYSTFIHYGQSSVTCVPYCVSNLEMVGRILEDTMWHSHYNLRKEYIDTTVTYKYVTDEDSAAVLDMLLDNIHFDIACVINSKLIEDLRTCLIEEDTALDLIIKNKRAYQMSMNQYITGIKAAKY